MKYIKTYEKKKEVIIYKNKDFDIEQNDGTLSYGSTILASATAIMVMAMLIHENSPHLDDPDLRSIQLRQTDKDFITKNLKLTDKKLKTIGEYKSGNVSHFFDRNFKESIPESVYKDITRDYYPIIEEAINKSDTMGDIIDNFKIIHEELSVENIEMRIKANDFNI